MGQSKGVPHSNRSHKRTYRTDWDVAQVESIKRSIELTTLELRVVANERERNAIRARLDLMHAALRRASE